MVIVVIPEAFCGCDHDDPLGPTTHTLLPAVNLPLLRSTWWDGVKVIRGYPLIRLIDGDNLTVDLPVKDPDECLLFKHHMNLEGVPVIV